MTGAIATVQREKGEAAAAWITERERVRRARSVRHLVVGLVAIAGLILVADFPVPLVGFVAGIALLAVALDAFAKAIDAHLGWAWGWLYGDPSRSTWIDRVCDRLVSRIPKPRSPIEEAPPSRVRVLPPR